MAAKKGIQIKCTGTDTLSFEKIEDFQGNLKKRTQRDIDLIIKSINKYGFSFPFYIWKTGKHNYCLDGHGRIQALKQMENEGIKLPLFPVVYITAKNKEEAKNKLLRLNSQFGQITTDGIVSFMDELNIDWDELKMYNQELITDPFESFNPEDEWIGMPEFEIINKPFKLNILFTSEKNRDKFVKEKEIKVMKQKEGSIAWSTWWPYVEKQDLQGFEYETEEE